MHWIWPALLLLLAIALGYWVYVNETGGRKSPSREAGPSLPAPATNTITGTSTKTNPAPAFSAQQALRALYGNYDPNLDGAFWTVSGASAPHAQWNGKPVFLRPLISRTFEQRGAVRHILVTNSLDVKDGLVVKQGAGCRTCPSLIGAAVFEKTASGWKLISRHDVLTADGAWGAPPKVSLQLGEPGGIELRFDRPAVDNRNPGGQYSIVLRERTARGP